MEFYLIRTIEALLTPPGLMIFMMLVGILLVRYYFQFGRALVFTGFILLIVCSLPVTSKGLYFLLETDLPLAGASLSRTTAESIVVLGGGRYGGVEYGGETVSAVTLERLRYGAWLQDQTGLPILVSGGNPRGEASAEATLMQQTLLKSFKSKARWVEKKSRNTRQNAIFSWLILQKEGIKRVYLVTHAYHMSRSRAAFQSVGFDVIPAPLGFRTEGPVSLLSFIPSSHALSNCQTAFHELIGRLWYFLRY